MIDLSPVFRPRVVAVVGASATSVTPGNEFIRHSRALGFNGRLVLIHPKAERVEGLPAVKSFADLDETVDFAYIAVRADNVPEVIEDAAGKLRFAQVMSSGFGEVPEGRDLERRLLQAARSAGVRLIGPNCLGVYSPMGGLSFLGGSSKAAGAVSVLSQSGGLAGDVILRGQNRGLRYRAVITLGNSADLGPADFLEYFLADRETSVVGLYAEDIKDGRAFVRALRSSKEAKPVVVLVGGQSAQGQNAAASHTGSLASSIATWRGLARQTGLVLVDTVDQFLDVLLAFQTLRPKLSRPTTRCVLFGNGGGASVLAADAFARCGLEVSRLPEEAIQQLEALRLPPGTSLANPIDTNALTLRVEEGKIAESILDIVTTRSTPDAIVVHINLPMFMQATEQRVDFLQNIVDAVIRCRARSRDGTHFTLVLRSDGSEAVERRRRNFRVLAALAGIPVYDEMANVADALAGLAFYERFSSARLTCDI
jgi:acyl-CoA synthetase (NDP forming)